MVIVKSQLWREDMESFEQEYSMKRMILKDVIPLKLPLCISLEASNMCNFRCIMCYHGSAQYAEASKPLQNMDMSLFDKCICDIKQWCKKEKKKIKVMKLYSLGEPLIHPNIGDMVRVIKDADICELLEITSNASLLTNHTAEELVDNGLDIFRASIYSVNEIRNHEITQTSISPDSIKEKIIYMRQYRDKNGKSKPFISAKMIDSYSEENQKFIEIYSQIVDEAYIDKIMDSPANKDTVERYYKERAEKVREDISDKRLYKVRKACRYPFTHMTVRSDGKVIVCCADWLQKTVVGNVQRNSLEEIWNSKVLYDFRCMTLKTKGLGNSLCAQCDIPLRDFPEDDIDDFPLDKLQYWKEENTE